MRMEKEQIITATTGAIPSMGRGGGTIYVDKIRNLCIYDSCSLGSVYPGQTFAHTNYNELAIMELLTCPERNSLDRAHTAWLLPTAGQGTSPAATAYAFVFEVKGRN